MELDIKQKVVVLKKFNKPEKLPSHRPSVYTKEISDYTATPATQERIKPSPYYLAKNVQEILERSESRKIEVQRIWSPDPCEPPCIVTMPISPDNVQKF